MEAGTLNQELSEHMLVKVPDSVKPSYIFQEVTLDEDLAEELRKTVPVAREPGGPVNKYPEAALTGLKEMPLIRMSNEMNMRMSRLAIDGTGRIYRKHASPGASTGNSASVFMFSEDGAQTGTFFSGNDFQDLSANKSGIVCLLDSYNNRVSVYNPDGTLGNRFDVRVKPASFVDTPPIDFYAIEPNGNRLMPSFDPDNRTWPTQLKGAMCVSTLNGYCELQFPKNGKLGIHGDYALIPGSYQTANEYGESVEDKLVTGNEFTVSVWVTPSVRTDFSSQLASNPDARIICTNNVISTKEMGLGLVVWNKLVDNKPVTKSFLRLSVAGSSGFSTFELNIIPNRRTHFVLVKDEASYRFYMDGVLIRSGDATFSDSRHWPDIYLGGDIPANESFRKIVYNSTPSSYPNGLSSVPNFPEYFFQGTISNFQLIPSGLSDEDIRLLEDNQQVRLTCIKNNETTIYVAEQSFKKILAFNHTGNLKKIYDLTGLQTEDEIADMSLDGTGSLYVLVNPSGRIYKLDESGNWNTSWTQAFDEPDAAYRCNSIYAHGSGMVYAPFQSAVKTGVLILDTDGQVLFELVSPTFLNSIKMVVTPRGYFYFENHSLYKPLTGDYFIADFRAAQWRLACRNILAELNYSRLKYNSRKALYEGAQQKDRLSLDSSSYLDELHGVLREALFELQERESEWLAFKDFLLGNGMVTSGSEKNIENRILFLQERDKYLLNYLLAEMNETERKTDIRHYTVQDGQYLDQYGVSLELYLERLNTHPDYESDIILLLPLDEARENGRTLFIRNPSYSGRIVSPPKCFFREEYKMDLSWLGVAPGQYSHSINLLPGETRNIKVTTKRMRSSESSVSSLQKHQEKSGRESDSQVKNISDFEGKLHNELENRKNNIDELSSYYNSGSKNKTEFNAGFKIPGFGLGLDIGASSETTSSRNGDSMHKKTLDTVKKNVKNLISKTSTEVSETNKVLFSEETQSETTQSRQDKETQSYEQVETIRVHNPNMGRTINYHFFQLQNLYGTVIHAEGATLHFDTGVEIIAGTGITGRYSYTLPSFNRLFNNLDAFKQSDRQKIMNLLSAFILRRYLRIGEEELNGMPRIAKPLGGRAAMSNAQLKTLRTSLSYAPDLWRDIDLEKVEDIMNMPFVQNPVKIAEQEVFSVNSGHFFVDSQVGAAEAVEDYLVERREIETETRRAQVAEIRARTGKGVFYPALPGTITHLNYDNTPE